MKKCSKCKNVKSLMLFCDNNLARDGKQTVCKDCQREYSRIVSKRKRKKTDPLIAMNGEEFKEFVDNYLISNYGRVYRCEHTSMGRFIRGMFMRITKLSIGYNKVSVGGKMYFIHRLVAEMFIDNPHNKPQVNHIDSNRINNHYSNLEWVTQYENITHARKKNRMGRKLSGDDVYKIKYNRKSYCIKDIADEFGVSTTNVRLILSNKIWKHI